MLKNVKITRKFPLVMISLALLSALVTGMIAYTSTAKHIKSSANQQLVSLLESRRASLNQYSDSIKRDLEFFSSSPLLREAIVSFSNAWHSLPEDKTGYLKQQYIYKNPYRVGQKDAFAAAEDQSQYSKIHRKFHPTLRNLLQGEGYYDFFLIDPLGNIIYSVNKEQDFATNLFHGEWKSTAIARIFNLINEQPAVGEISFADFSSYAPSAGEPASFVATPIFSAETKYLGTAMFQLPIETINKIMQVTAGMGNSGETYLVGPDKLMRSDSRFLRDRSILNTLVDTPSSKAALAGETSSRIIKDYRDIAVFSAYSSVEFLGATWAIIAEIDETEIMAPIESIRSFLWISGLMIALVISIVGYILATDISEPIIKMTGMMNQLSNNNLEVDISVEERRDEVGHMANAMQVFKRNAQEREQLQQALAHIADHDTLTGSYTRKYAMDKLPLLLESAKQQYSKVVMMFIDLDDFKLINDIHGHQTGDIVLSQVAMKLQENVRKEDIVARIGGDEFIIILPKIESIDEGLEIADNILAAVRPQLPVIGDSSRITLSIGLSIYPNDANNASDLLSHADMAMYSAKGQGKNTVNAWNPSMQRVTS